MQRYVRYQSCAPFLCATHTSAWCTKFPAASSPATEALAAHLLLLWDQEGQEQTWGIGGCGERTLTISAHHWSLYYYIQARTALYELEVGVL